MAKFNLNLVYPAVRPLQKYPIRFISFKSSIFSNLTRTGIFLIKSTTHSALPIKPISTVVVAAAAAAGRKVTETKGGIHAIKKKFTTVEKRAFVMEEEEPKSYNRKRMEGLDKAAPKQVKLKTRNINPVNTIAYVQILGTGMDTQDTSPSVLLFFDHQRFIFNAGEGIQRFCTEHKFKLSRLDHIFLTRVCSETAGGLPGLLLTMAGIGDDGMAVNIWGPSDLEYLVGAMRLFIPNSAVVHTHSFGPGHTSEGSAVPHNSNGSISTNQIVLFKDKIVQLSAVLLLPNGVRRGYEDVEDGMEVSQRTNNNVAENTDSAHKRSRLGLERSSKIAEPTLEVQASYEPGDIAVVYICELPDIKGKFDLSKAQALGLKAGPKYRKLQLGKSVMSDTMNIMVHPSDVLGPSSPGPIVLFVDCPTISHLPDLQSAPALSKFFTCKDDGSESLQKHVNCVVHLSPSSVTRCAEYVDWMSKFVGTQHIMAGHEVKNAEYPILKSSARLSTRLNFLCPQLFPVPGFRSVGVENSLEGVSAHTSQDDGMMFHGSILADNLLKFHLRPYARLGLDRSSVPSLPSASNIIDELLSEIPEIMDASKQIAQLWNSLPGEQNENPKSIEPQHQNENLKLIEPQVCVSTFVEDSWIKKRTSIPESEFEGINNGDSQKEMQLKHPIEVKGCKSTDEIPKCLDGITRNEMEIVFLGTGSSVPSKYRNVSSIFVNLFRHGGVLLDCGEGTLAQLKRRFGVSGADDVIKSLKCIWISHIHADHHTGLARILSVRKQLLKNESHESLLVIGPKSLKRYLDAYLVLEELNMQFLDCRQTTKLSIDAFEQISADSGDYSGYKQENPVSSNLISITSGNEEAQHARQSRIQPYGQRPGIQDGAVLDLTGLRKLKKVLSEAGLEVLTSVPVVHCRDAFGVVLQAVRKNNADEIVPGWKLVYSGDTRPCKDLIDAARGATVLIHEATFDDSMLEEAISKNHSLTKEAIEVGASAGAYRIILTHFSQRYPKIPVFDESYTDRTCIAFDLMTVNLADLPLVPKINPYLKLLFKNEMVAEEGSENENMIEDTTVAL